MSDQESNEKFAETFDRELYRLLTTARQLGLTADDKADRKRWLAVHAALAGARTHVVPMLQAGVLPA